VSEQDAPFPVRRPLRSFVRREGHFTPSQRRAVDELLPQYELTAAGVGAGVLDLDQVFGRSAPRTLEIGFGNGEVLAALAEAEPERDFIGIEVYRPGLGRLLSRVAERGLGNVRVSGDDAVELLQQRLADASLDRIMVFFPDPWPKKRHHKRRLIQAPFARLLASKIKPGGQLCLATDWQDYAEQMLAVMEATPGLRNLHPGTGGDGYAPRPDYRPLTRFEQRGRRLGHGVWDLEYERVAGDLS
jgi:tRNA (guanine-N7-)-methyltransferase